MIDNYPPGVSSSTPGAPWTEPEPPECPECRHEIRRHSDHADWCGVEDHNELQEIVEIARHVTEPEVIDE